MKKKLSGNQIFIPSDVRSGKNSKQWTGKYLVYSKAAQKYIRKSAPYWKDNKEQFKQLIKDKSKPLRIGFLFIRGSKHKFDYHNMVQLPLDLMQKHDWIEDDCADVVIPEFLPYKYDKKNPGLIIEI